MRTWRSPGAAAAFDGGIGRDGVRAGDRSRRRSRSDSTPRLPARHRRRRGCRSAHRPRPAPKSALQARRSRRCSRSRPRRVWIDPAASTTSSVPERVGRGHGPARRPRDRPALCHRGAAPCHRGAAVCDRGRDHRDDGEHQGARDPRRARMRSHRRPGIRRPRRSNGARRLTTRAVRRPCDWMRARLAAGVVAAAGLAACGFASPPRPRSRTRSRAQAPPGSRARRSRSR